MLWLDGVRSWETVLPLPKPPTWDQQIARMKMFDDLIGNSDRNKGNLLVDADWHIYLIDHSRAFVTDNKLPQELQNIDRRLWERMQALDAASLKTALGNMAGQPPDPGAAEAARRDAEEDRRARREARRARVLLSRRPSGFLRTQHEQADAGDERDATEHRRQRNGLVPFGRGFDRADVEHLLAASCR